MDEKIENNLFGKIINAYKVNFCDATTDDRTISCYLENEGDIISLNAYGKSYIPSSKKVTLIYGKSFLSLTEKNSSNCDNDSSGHWYEVNTKPIILGAKPETIKKIKEEALRKLTLEEKSILGLL